MSPHLNPLRDAERQIAGLLGSAGASPALFGALAEKHEDVFREARDKAGEVPALPKKSRREQSTQATQSPPRLALCSLPPCPAGVYNPT